jgi:iron-sulfur cluster repair protein YtfE (RIC family)
MEITIKKDDLVEDILEKHPNAAEFLQEMGIVCFQCGEAVWGTIESIIDKKGLDVDQTLQKLNAFLNSTKQQKHTFSKN